MSYVLLILRINLQCREKVKHNNNNNNRECLRHFRESPPKYYILHFAAVVILQ